MTLPLDVETLRAAYAYLATTPPFDSWNLPDAEDVVFKVVRDPKIRGDYRWDNGRHVIRVSRNTIGHTLSLMWVMAHEMIHVHEEHSRACGRGEHSAAFKRWIVQVANVHGFDERLL